MNTFYNFFYSNINNAPVAFGKAVGGGFLFAFSLILFFFPLEENTIALLFKLIIGVVFIGMLLNWTLMELSAFFLESFNTMIGIKIDREQLFIALIWGHSSMILAIALKVVDLVFPDVLNKVGCIVVLEIISVLLLIYFFKKYQCSR